MFRIPDTKRESVTPDGATLTLPRKHVENHYSDSQLIYKVNDASLEYHKMVMSFFKGRQG